MKITPGSLLSQRLLIIAPHMDDEILGCGATMLLHEDKSRIHCIYATDGAQSPAPLLPWTGSINPDITKIRRQEAIDVMAGIGIPRDNLVFLDFPDGTLYRRSRQLKSRLSEEISRIDPAVVLTPFRYDLHSDHVATNRCTRSVLSGDRKQRVLLEYLVYYRWRLIESGDIRTQIPDTSFLTVDTRQVVAEKTAIIHQYRSQTEILSDWQSQPILTAKSIADRCGDAESFLVSDPDEPPSRIFGKARFRVVAAHFLQRLGKRRKDQLAAFLAWLLPIRTTQQCMSQDHHFPSSSSRVDPLSTHRYCGLPRDWSSSPRFNCWRSFPNRRFVAFGERFWTCGGDEACWHP